MQTKTEYLESLKNKRLVYNKIDSNQASVRIVATTATVVGKCIFHITAGVSDHTFHMSYTQVYALENNKWKLALYAVHRIAE